MTGSGGMTPRQWGEDDERRKERGERLGRAGAPEVSERARTITAAVIALIVLAMIVYAILGWIGVVPIPGITTT